MKQLVLASSNPGKLAEFSTLFAPSGIEIIPQSKLGITDAEEPHGTFVENALAKARHAARHSRLPAMSDDSGICVCALDGAPGVHSARFAAEAAGAVGSVALPRDAQDRANNDKLLSLLAGQAAALQIAPGQVDRRAHYYCVIVLVRHADDPEPIIADGAWHGEILNVPAGSEGRGSNGFGYDPYFLVPDLGRTAAELDPTQKNAISHRGKALRRLLARLKEEG